MSMFCYQCEQTAKGSGCTVAGVCGKDSQTAALQDLLLYASEGVAMSGPRAALGGKDAAADRFVLEALFSTVTNVNFDPQRLVALLGQAGATIASVRELYEQTAQELARRQRHCPGRRRLCPRRRWRVCWRRRRRWESRIAARSSAPT